MVKCLSGGPPQRQELRRPDAAQERHGGGRALHQRRRRAPVPAAGTLHGAPLPHRLHQVRVVAQPGFEGLRRAAAGLGKEGIGVQCLKP